MRISWNSPYAWFMGALITGGVLTWSALAQRNAPDTTPKNLLVNPGFEDNARIGHIPQGWRAVDENEEYWGWVGPRVERRISEVIPRTGTFMVGLASEVMGVDTNGEDFFTPRSALYQTIRVPGRCRGVFSVYYNDLETELLGHASTTRLAYSVNHADIHRITVPVSPQPSLEDEPRPDFWSRKYFCVNQYQPLNYESTGDWTLIAMPVIVDTDEPEVDLTLWIGVFENQSGTAVAYWRYDDASFTLQPER